MGRFKSDDQRKAIFANMFSGSDSKKSRVDSSNTKNMNTKIENKPRKIEKQKVSFSESKSRNLRGYHRMNKDGNHDKSCPHYSQMMESGSRKYSSDVLKAFEGERESLLDSIAHSLPSNYSYDQIWSDPEMKSLEHVNTPKDVKKYLEITGKTFDQAFPKTAKVMKKSKVKMSESRARKYESNKDRDVKTASYKDIEKIKKDTKIGLLLTGHIRNHYRKKSVDDMKEFISYYDKPGQKEELEAHFKKFFSDAKNVKSVAEFRKLSDKEYKDVGDIMFKGSTGFVGPNWDSEAQVVFNNLPRGLLKTINKRVNELGYKNVKGYQL